MKVIPFSWVLFVSGIVSCTILDFKQVKMNWPEVIYRSKKCRKPKSIIV